MRTRNPMPDFNYLAGQNVTESSGTLTFASGAASGTVVSGAITLDADLDSSAIYHLGVYNNCSGSVNTINVYNQITFGGSKRDILLSSTAVQPSTGTNIKLEGLGLAESMKITTTNSSVVAGPTFLEVYWILKDA
jgi:hypothetical protein